MVARGLAIVQTCVYDAWAAYDDVAIGTRLGGSLRRPAGERPTLDGRARVDHALLDQTSPPRKPAGESLRRAIACGRRQFVVIEPKRPSDSSFGPAVKNSVSTGPLF